jgi:predicted nucleic acid-binding protein
VSRFVLDSSVACAWYFDEPWSKSARIWIDRCLDGEIQLVVPGVHFLEMGNVLRTRVRLGVIDRHEARAIWSLHRSVPLSARDPALEATLERCLDLDATFYDAVYVALAEELDAPLLTAERTTRPWVRKLGRRAIVVR